MNCLSYALFGYGQGRQENCFDFHSLLRGLLLNIRLARLLYPGWMIVLSLDRPSYEAYKNLWTGLNDLGVLRLNVRDPAAICEGMLWRLLPVFERENNSVQANIYDRVLCRDVDSPLTYRERRCVEQWIQNGKAAHAITDSVSHTIPMMGGMIGFVSRHWQERTGFDNFDKMIAEKGGTLSYKGSDQNFLGRHVYPKYAKHGDDSITQHYLLGMPNTFLSDWHDSVPDIEVEGAKDYKQFDEPHIASHCGQSGWVSPAMENEINKLADMFKEISKIEAQYSETTYWGKA